MTATTLRPPRRCSTCSRSSAYFYELRYEIDHRPDWIAVPLSGLAAMLADDD
jgi:hypothetical protein